MVEDNVALVEFELEVVDEVAFSVVNVLLVMVEVEFVVAVELIVSIVVVVDVALLVEIDVLVPWGSRATESSVHFPKEALEEVKTAGKKVGELTSEVEYSVKPSPERTV